MSADSQLLIGIEEAARRLSVSRSGLYALIGRGFITPIYLDRRPRIDARELEALVESARVGVSP